MRRKQNMESNELSSSQHRATRGFSLSTEARVFQSSSTNEPRQTSSPLSRRWRSETDRKHLSKDDIDGTNHSTTSSKRFSLTAVSRVLDTTQHRRSNSVIRNSTTSSSRRRGRGNGSPGNADDDDLTATNHSSNSSLRLSFQSMSRIFDTSNHGDYNDLSSTDGDTSPRKSIKAGLPNANSHVRSGDTGGSSRSRSCSPRRWRAPDVELEESDHLLSTHDEDFDFEPYVTVKSRANDSRCVRSATKDKVQEARRSLSNCRLRVDEATENIALRASRLETASSARRKLMPRSKSNVSSLRSSSRKKNQELACTDFAQKPFASGPDNTEDRGESALRRSGFFRDYCSSQGGPEILHVDDLLDRKALRRRKQDAVFVVENEDHSGSFLQLDFAALQVGA